MPDELKRRLAAEVAERGSNLNDVAVGILAARFAVPFEPSGRKGTAPKGAGDVLLRMPAELKQTLQERAADARTNTNELINEILAERLGAPAGARTARSGSPSSESETARAASSRAVTTTRLPRTTSSYRV